MADMDDGQALDVLEGLLNRLGPGISLVLDQAAFPQFFGSDIGSEKAEAAAQIFASKLGCRVQIEDAEARFGRAYPGRPAT